MCEATTLAAASLAIAAVGTGASIYGQVQAGQAASAQANYKAAVDRNNAILASRAAGDARAQGEVAAAKQAQAGAQLVGRQRAVLASNGVVVDTGSAADLTAETKGQNRLDELTIRNNAERQALGFEAQGMNYQSQANMDLLAGTSAESAAGFGAIGSGLKGAGTVASQWYDFNKAGVFSGSSGGGSTYAPSAAFYAQ